MVYPRSSEPDTALTSTFNFSRPFPFTSSYQDNNPRINSSEATGDTLRLQQQTSSTSNPNVLPPLESTVSVNQSRSGPQSTFGSNLVPSMEIPSFLPSPAQASSNRGQDDYDAGSLDFSTPARRADDG